MNRNWKTGIAFAVAAILAIGGLNAEEPKKEEKAPKRATKEELKEMMTKLHKGEKSPLARTGAEVKKESPDWEQLAKDVKGFVEMGEVLKVSASPYTPPKGYIDGAAALTKAVGKKDKQASAQAFTALTQSCSVCHYGNPAK